MEKIAFLFPGQGSQYIGMSKTLYDKYEIARNTFEEANDILGFDLSKLCFEGNLAELCKTENALVALFVTSVINFRVYMKEIGIAPHFCAGHSLGEYSALTCGGVMKFGDAVRIVRKRGELAQEIAGSGTGAMTIIDNIEREPLEEECKKASKEGQIVSISCYNSMNQIAISGHQDAVMKVEDRVMTMGAQVTPLIGNAPFHSILMQPAAEKLREELKKYKFYNSQWPIISNVTGLPYGGPEEVIDLLTNQIIKPVQWRKTMEYLNKMDVTLSIELGVKNVLSNLTKSNFEGMNSLCFDQKEDRRVLMESFARDEQYTKHVPTVVTKCLGIAVAVPNINWSNEEYQEGVVQPYRRIQEIQNEIDNENKAPTVEQMREALEMLKIIFKTKKLPIEEQAEWFNHIINETGTYYLFNDLNKIAI